MILYLYLWVYFYFLCNVCVCVFFSFFHKVASLLGLWLFWQPATWFIYVQLLHYIAIHVVANKVLSLRFWYSFGAGPLRGLKDTTDSCRQFFKDNLVAPSFQNFGSLDLYHIQDEDRPIICAARLDFMFWNVFSFWHYSTSNAKFRSHFALVDLSKD